MEKIKADKANLIKILKENRSKHRQIFEEAQEGFKKAIISVLEKRLDAARQGKKINQYLGLIEPADQTKDYDRAIAMLEMHKENDVELSEQDFRQYVMDDWSWRNQFLSSNSAYSVTAASLLATEGNDEESMAIG